jgi:hypothetical protein
MADCGDMLDDPDHWRRIAQIGGALGVCINRRVTGCAGAMRPVTELDRDGHPIPGTLAESRVNDATVAYESRCDRCQTSDTLFADGRTAAYAAERSRRDRGITTHRQRAMNPPAATFRTAPVDRS